MTTSEGLDATSPVKEFILLYLMPEKCFEYFFTNLNFLHVPCLKIVLSKTVGLWIVLGTVLAQLPQLLRLTRRGSADGVSLGSALLHLYSILGPLVYCLARDFPLSAWSDKLFIAVQAASVCFLLLHYRGRTIQGMLLVLVYGAVVVLLGLLSRLAPTSPAVRQESCPVCPYCWYGRAPWLSSSSLCRRRAPFWLFWPTYSLRVSALCYWPRSFDAVRESAPGAKPRENTQPRWKTKTVLLGVFRCWVQPLMLCSLGF
ncbi:mannose-P-dolichol utilization defect 1 protein isoform X2 [Gadus morhua]|uniref:mannose-P-dolichol utilization defect 1 protein isoform X2 n=1 Tax=Gadus morhua TaxID=8049 RepID=UPI0011B60B79|nr:mannose-P-dolichol utilization defect 1 protein-like isoform X2 [Gadus morhua]